jgi:hypothetical protein
MRAPDATRSATAPGPSKCTVHIFADTLGDERFWNVAVPGELLAIDQRHAAELAAGIVRLIRQHTHSDGEVTWNTGRSDQLLVLCEHGSRWYTAGDDRNMPRMPVEPRALLLRLTILRKCLVSSQR